MVKTPRPRHSKKTRAPVTIDLTANAEPTDEAAKIEPVDAEIVSEATVDQALPGDDMVREPVDIEAAPEEAIAEAAPVEEPTASEYGADNSEPEKPTGDTYSRNDYAFNEPSKPAEPPRAAATPAPRRGGVSSIAAGLIGAIVALGGAWGLQQAGILPDGAAATQSPSLQPLQDELAALKADFATLKAAPAPDSSGLAATVGELKTELAKIQSAVQSGGAGDQAAVAALNDKLTALESQVASAASNAPAEINDKLSGLEGQVTQVGDAVAKTDSRLAALEQSVSGLGAKVEQASEQPRVALAIAAAGIKSAVERGGSFAPELDTLAAVAPDAPELAALKPYAADGAPSQTQLLAEIGPAAEAMIAAGTPVDANAGFFQRLIDSAKSSIKVRPVGDVAGDDIGARTARMENELKAGEYSKALAEYDGVTDPAAKAAGASFAARLKARIETQKLVDQLMAAAMKAS